jgi:hypothetical protein
MAVEIGIDLWDGLGGIEGIALGEHSESKVRKAVRARYDKRISVPYGSKTKPAYFTPGPITWP